MSISCVFFLLNIHQHGVITALFPPEGGLGQLVS